MAVDKNDSGKGAATIDIEKLAGTGNTDIDLDDTDLDLGNDVDDDADAGGDGDELTDEERAAAAKAKKDGKKPKAEPKKKEKAKADVEEEELADEDEEETDDEDEEEAEEEVEEKPKPKMIPAKQLARVKAKRIAAEESLAKANERIAALEKAASGNADLEKFQEEMDQLYIDVEAARAEGDAAKAAKLQRKIDDRRDAANRQQSAYISANEAVRIQNGAAYDLLLEQVELLVPALNQDHDDFDEDVAQEVRELVEGFARSGRYTPAQSLKKAVRAVVGNVFEKKTETVVEPKKAEPKKTDVAKNAAAAKRAPPEAVKEVRTEKSKALDPNKLTQAEWDALPDETVKRLRGDFLED